LAGVLAQARRRVKDRRIIIDPERWQCCITEELLALAQDGREEDALESLLERLLDHRQPDLCPDPAQCRGTGCSVRPKGRVVATRVKEKVS
jgi:hypothetical protein